MAEGYAEDNVIAKSGYWELKQVSFSGREGKQIQGFQLIKPSKNKDWIKKLWIKDEGELQLIADMLLTGLTNLQAKQQNAEAEQTERTPEEEQTEDIPF